MARTAARPTATSVPRRRVKTQKQMHARPARGVELSKGDWIDVMDSAGIWNVARVLSAPSPGKVKVMYDGWGAEYDEVVQIASDRVAPFHTYTWAVKCWVKYKNWPPWPSIVTIRPPGNQIGVASLQQETRLLVDFLDNTDFGKRDRFWNLIKHIQPLNANPNTSSDEMAFQASLVCMKQSSASTEMPKFVKGGTLPVQFAKVTTKSVEQARKEMGDDMWFKKFADSRERHLFTHVYEDIGHSPRDKGHTVVSRQSKKAPATTRLPQEEPQEIVYDSDDEVIGSMEPRVKKTPVRKKSLVSRESRQETDSKPQRRKTRKSMDSSLPLTREPGSEDETISPKKSRSKTRVQKKSVAVTRGKAPVTRAKAQEEAAKPEKRKTLNSTRSSPARMDSTARSLRSRSLNLKASVEKDPLALAMGEIEDSSDTDEDDQPSSSLRSRPRLTTTRKPSPPVVRKENRPPVSAVADAKDAVADAKEILKPVRVRQRKLTAKETATGNASDANRTRHGSRTLVLNETSPLLSKRREADSDNDAAPTSLVADAKEPAGTRAQVRKLPAKEAVTTIQDERKSEMSNTESTLSLAAGAKEPRKRLVTRTRMISAKEISIKTERLQDAHIKPEESLSGAVSPTSTSELKDEKREEVGNPQQGDRETQVSVVASLVAAKTTDERGSAYISPDSEAVSNSFDFKDEAQDDPIDVHARYLSTRETLSDSIKRKIPANTSKAMSKHPPTQAGNGNIVDAKTSVPVKALNPAPPRKRGRPPKKKEPSSPAVSDPIVRQQVASAKSSGKRTLIDERIAEAQKAILEADGTTDAQGHSRGRKKRRKVAASSVHVTVPLDDGSKPANANDEIYRSLAAHKSLDLVKDEHGEDTGDIPRRFCMMRVGDQVDASLAGQQKKRLMYGWQHSFMLVSAPRKFVDHPGVTKDGIKSVDSVNELPLAPASSGRGLGLLPGAVFSSSEGFSIDSWFRRKMYAKILSPM